MKDFEVYRTLKNNLNALAIGYTLEIRDSIGTRWYMPRLAVSDAFSLDCLVFFSKIVDIQRQSCLPNVLSLWRYRYAPNILLHNCIGDTGAP